MSPFVNASTWFLYSLLWTTPWSLKQEVTEGGVRVAIDGSGSSWMEKDVLTVRIPFWKVALTTAMSQVFYIEFPWEIEFSLIQLCSSTYFTCSKEVVWISLWCSGFLFESAYAPWKWAGTNLLINQVLICLENYISNFYRVFVIC